MRYGLRCFASLGGKRIALAFELLDNTSLIYHRLSNYRIGQKLVCNNRLLLFCRTIGPKDATVPKIQMRCKVVKMFRLVSFMGHRSAQLLAINPTKQINVSAPLLNETSALY